MRFVIHDQDGLFTDALKEYCEEKITRPILKHHLDDPSTSIDVDAVQAGDDVEIRVKAVVPHHPLFRVEASDPDAYAAIDLAADRLARVVRDAEERRRARRRRATAETGAPLAEFEDEMTAEEDEALREMGALDAVLEQ